MIDKSEDDSVGLHITMSRELRDAFIRLLDVINARFCEFHAIDLLDFVVDEIKKEPSSGCVTGHRNS